jgi:hypothetical protein
MGYMASGYSGQWPRDACAWFRPAHSMFHRPLTAAAARTDRYGAPHNHRDGSGHYEPGTRKCSVCQEFKTKKDFNAEEADKPASKRCCYACGAASGLLPTDLAKLTVLKLKEELEKRGLETKGLKAALVSRLQKVVDTEEPKARPPSAPTPKKTPKSSQKIPQQAHSYIFDFGQHMGKSLADVWAKDPSYIRWMQSSGVHYKYSSLHDTLARCGTITLVLSTGHTESFRVPARVVAAPAAPQPAKKRKAADVLGDLKNPTASKKQQVAACGEGLSCVCGKVFRDDKAKEQHLNDSRKCPGSRKYRK